MRKILVKLVTVTILMATPYLAIAGNSFDTNLAEINKTEIQSNHEENIKELKINIKKSIKRDVEQICKNSKSNEKEDKLLALQWR